MHDSGPREPRRYWWVNQGDTYSLERKNSCLFASQTDSDLKHHTNIMRVRPNDLILHYVKGSIVAVGMVKRMPWKDIRPYEDPPRYLAVPGYRAEVDYHELDLPIARDEIPLIWREGEAPFKDDGTLKQQYLNQLSPAFIDRLVSLCPDRLPDLLVASRTSAGGSSAVR